MRKRVIAIILAVCFCAVLMPSVARADLSDAERAAYTAYLEVLQNNKKGIDCYDWQKGYTLELDEETLEVLPLTEETCSRPVVLCDIYGDYIPELIYIGDAEPGYYDGRCYTNESWINLHILTYKNGKAVSIYEEDWYGWGDAALTYHLYQIRDSKELYIESAIGDVDFEDITYRLMEGRDGLLHKEAVCSHGWDEDDKVFYHGASGLSITEFQYNEKIRSLQAKTTSVLMYSMWMDETTMSFIKKNGCPAMTCDEAISFLRSKLNESPITTLDNLLKDSTQYNNDIASLAAELCLATYTANNTSKDVNKYLNRLGFVDENIYSNNYGGSLAYTVASKQYAGSGADGMLVIVAQGSTNPYELSQDAFTSAGEIINGQETYDIVRDFYKDIMNGIKKVTQSDKEYRTLVCGHSLGGAAANLVAASLTRGYYGKENVFCYTFGAIDSITNKTLQTKGYENIHNVYNLLDTWSPYQYGKSLPSWAGRMTGKFGEINSFSCEFRTEDQQNEIAALQMWNSVNHQMHNYVTAVQSGIVEVNYRLWNSNCSVIACPVDVFVYRNGECIGKVEKNEVSKETDAIEILVESDVKFIYYPDNAAYELEIKAYDSGEMIYSVFSPQEGTSCIIENIELQPEKSFQTEVSSATEVSETKFYVLGNDGAPVRTVNEDGTETDLPLSPPTVAPSTAPPTANSTTSAPQAYVTIVNVKNKASVRKDASSDTKRLGYVYNDETYPLIAVKGQWYKIQYKSDVIGYVHKDYIRATNEHLVPHTENEWEAITPAPTKQPTPKPTPTQSVYVTEPPAADYTADMLQSEPSASPIIIETETEVRAEETTVPAEPPIITDISEKKPNGMVLSEDDTLKDSWLLFVLIGASATLVIILICIAAILIHRKRTSSRRLLDDTDDFEEVDEFEEV